MISASPPVPAVLPRADRQADPRWDRVAGWCWDSPGSGQFAANRFSAGLAPRCGPSRHGNPGYPAGDMSGLRAVRLSAACVQANSEPLERTLLYPLAPGDPSMEHRSAFSPPPPARTVGSRSSRRRRPAVRVTPAIPPVPMGRPGVPVHVPPLAHRSCSDQAVTSRRM